MVLVRILIAVDCSASIDEETLSRFFSLQNRLFRDGDFELELMQFDAQILAIESMSQIRPIINIAGRGGTNFQPVIDYFLSHTRQYDALMILTDGEASPPILPQHHAPLLWVCSTEDTYNQHHLWMEMLGRCCFL